MQEWRIEEQRRPGSRGRNKGCGGRCSKSRGSSRGCRNIEGTGIKGTGVYRSIKDEAWPLLKDVTDSEPEPKAKQREYAVRGDPLVDSAACTQDWRVGKIETCGRASGA